MRLKQLIRDDDAVSPVIGVILMVAITVILAAVIATFVLGLGDSISNTTPQASFSFQWDGSSGETAPLDITHDGGDSISAGEIYIRGDAGDTDTDLGGAWYEYSGGDANSDVTAGNSITIDDDNGDADNGEIGAAGEVDVIWQPSNGDTSATLSDWSGPDA